MAAPHLKAVRCGPVAGLRPLDDRLCASRTGPVLSHPPVRGGRNGLTRTRNGLRGATVLSVRYLLAIR